MRRSRLNPTNKRLYGIRVKVWLTCLIVILMGVIFYTLGVGFQSLFAPRYVYAQTSIIAPSPTPIIENPTTEQEEIIAYVKEVFGRDSDKALSLLKGTDKCHGENPSLRVDAVHVNNDSSKDYGLFQWNDYWNGFNKPVNNARYLFDYKIATNLTYRKFINDGHSFREWTSGKCQGI